MSYTPDLVHIYQTLHSPTDIYIFSSSTYETINQNLHAVHKASYNKFQKLLLIQNMFLYLSGIN